MEIGETEVGTRVVLRGKYERNCGERAANSP